MGVDEGLAVFMNQNQLPEGTDCPSVGARSSALTNMLDWLDRVAGGWEVGSLGIFTSGQPFSVSSGIYTGSNVTDFGPLGSNIAALADYSGKDRSIRGVQLFGGGVRFFSPEQAALLPTPREDVRHLSRRSLQLAQHGELPRPIGEPANPPNLWSHFGHPGRRVKPIRRSDPSRCPPLRFLVLHQAKATAEGAVDSARGQSHMLATCNTCFHV